MVRLVVTGAAALAFVIAPPLSSAPRSIGQPCYNGVLPWGPFIPELHAARPARAKVRGVGSRRQRDHRLPQPSRLPVLVRQRPVINDPRRSRSASTGPARSTRPLSMSASSSRSAGVVFAIYASTAREIVLVASLVPAILFAGGVGAFVKTYRVWKARGRMAGVARRGMVPAHVHAGVPVHSGRRDIRQLRHVESTCPSKLRSGLCVSTIRNRGCNFDG